MSLDSLPIITLPTADGNHITSRVKHRGTKTQAEVYAETALRIGNQPLTIPLIIRTHNEVILDWTSAGWKIAPLGDGLIAYLCSSGGTAPIGQEPTPTFDGLAVELRAHYGEAGRARAAAAFTAEKVGEQNRITPIFTLILSPDGGEEKDGRAQVSVELISTAVPPRRQPLGRRPPPAWMAAPSNPDGGHIQPG